jgi:hypothetical protein
MMSGGDEENRTPDPLLARQVLSQLSYTPKFYPTLTQISVGFLWFLIFFKISPDYLISCNNLLEIWWA